MRAIRHLRYGDAHDLALLERAPPRLGPHDVLVRVRAASINAADWFTLVGSPWVIRFSTGLFRPRGPIGLDLAGEVEAVGRDVVGLAPGDAVFGEGVGSFAELAVARAERLAPKPERVSFAQAATLPVAGCTALQGLRDLARVRPGQRVLVNGASGSVGTFTVAIARALGAEVTAVCSARNADRARALGASQVIDYARDDFTEVAPPPDVIFDLACSAPLRRCLRLLRPEGTYVCSVGRLGWLAKAALGSLFPGSRVKILAARATRADLVTLGEMVAQGALVPAIVREVGLADVPDAMRVQGEGHAQGKTVIRIA